MDQVIRGVDILDLVGRDIVTQKIDLADRDLPMVKELRWYYSVVGDVYTLENWAAFDDEAGWGEYRAALAGLKSDRTWESQRVSQDEWWDFLDTRIVTDLPVAVGFGHRDD